MLLDANWRLVKRPQSATTVVLSPTHTGSFQQFHRSLERLPRGPQLVEALRDLFCYAARIAAVLKWQTGNELFLTAQEPDVVALRPTATSTVFVEVIPCTQEALTLTHALV